MVPACQWIASFIHTHQGGKHAPALKNKLQENFRQKMIDLWTVSKESGSVEWAGSQTLLYTGVAEKKKMLFASYIPNVSVQTTNDYKSGQVMSGISIVRKRHTHTLSWRRHAASSPSCLDWIGIMQGTRVSMKLPTCPTPIYSRPATDGVFENARMHTVLQHEGGEIAVKFIDGLVSLSTSHWVIYIWQGFGDSRLVFIPNPQIYFLFRPKLY